LILILNPQNFFLDSFVYDLIDSSIR
jgi:hypothetical protein